MPINKESLQRRLERALGRYDAKPVDEEDEIIPLADEAVAFRFNFTKDGEDFGRVYVTIDDTNSLTVWFDDKIMDSPSTPTPGLDYDDSWTGFLVFIKKWAMNNQLSFKTDNKNHLGAEMARRKRMQEKEKISEGYHAMGKKASYNDAVPNVKIILQHNRAMQEGEQRFRHIEKIFVENQNGERFLVPTTKPGLARVFARHIAEGGTPYDERAGHIQSLVEEYNKMAGFVRATRSGQFNESAQQLVQEGINHYVSLRESLGKMTGHRGYTAYFESWTPSLMEDETDATAINELFVQETLDPRIESVMPILSRLHKQVAEMKEVTELSVWADSLVEEEGIQSQNPVGIPESEDLDDIGSKKKGVEAHGVHGMKSKPWRKKFKSQEAFEKWLEKNEGNVEVHGTRDLEEGVVDTLKKVGGKVLDTLGHGSDEELLKDLKKKASVRNPQTGKPSMAYSDVEKVDEDLGPEQKRVGQLGPTEKVKNNNIGKLVGANESIHGIMKTLDAIALNENFINTDAQAVTTEGYGSEENPVVSWLTNRVLTRHPELLQDYGLDSVKDAIDATGDFYNDEEEMGSSDKTAYFNYFMKELKSAAEQAAVRSERVRSAFGNMFGTDGGSPADSLSIREEGGADHGDLENDKYYVVDTQSGEVIDGPFDNTGEIPLRLMGFDGGHKVVKGSELKGLSEAKSDDPDYDKSLKRFKKGLPPKEKVDEGQEDLDAILRIIRK